MRERYEIGPKWELPNYTQVPNSILDNLERLKPSVLTVMLVMCRQTFGYHRKWTRVLSLGAISRLSGMHRRGVQNAVRQLEGVGWLVRRKSGRSFKYQLNMDWDGKEDA